MFYCPDDFIFESSVLGLVCVEGCVSSGSKCFNLRSGPLLARWMCSEVLERKEVMEGDVVGYLGFYPFGVDVGRLSNLHPDMVNQPLPELSHGRVKQLEVRFRGC